MRSRWFKLKPKAILLRKRGTSIRDIELSLGISRSTLSGWFKDIKLTKSQYASLKEKRDNALVNARKKAIVWHNKQKTNRLKFAENEANKTLLQVGVGQQAVELALAFLYLGEGFKKSPTTGMGNSDPLILKFFLKVLLDVYKIDIKKIGFYLHLRADQDPSKMKKYWAKELGAPIDRFKKISRDWRTVGKKTYKNYKGVCVIDCGNIAVQRKLVYISRKFCEKIINNSRV